MKRLIVVASLLSLVLALALGACTPTAPQKAEEKKQVGSEKTGPATSDPGGGTLMTPAKDEKPADPGPNDQKPADRKPGQPEADTPEKKPDPTDRKNDASAQDKPGDTTPDKQEPVVVAPKDPAEERSRQAGPVQVEVIPQYEAVYSGRSTDLNILVRLKGQKEGKGERPPLDLAIVIDRSGSMLGDKVRNVKQAALDLVEKLDARDKVTLITYSSEVVVEDERRPMDEAGRSRLKGKILEVEAGGRTALGPALFTALDILERAERTETEVAHVLLLSDGIANVGETRPENIAARAAGAFNRGISVSTLGVGLDYNEDLMTRVADQGGGRYHFVKDSIDITRVLNDEMAGLSSTVARGITLTIQPASGVSVVRVYGYPVDVSGGYQVIKVGSLSSGQVREILLRVQVPEGESATADLAKFALSFRDLVAGGTPVEDGVGLAVRTSADPEAVKKSERAEVAVRAAEVESADEMEKAAKAVDRGDYGAARTIIQSNIGRLREQAAATPSARLDTQMKSMEEAWGGVGKAEAGPPGAAQEFIKGSKARAYDLSK